MADDTIETHLLRSERRFVALPSGHRLARRKALQMSDLLSEPFVALPAEAVRTLIQHVAHDAHPGMGSLPPDKTLARRHAIALEAGTRMASLFGKETVWVNTIHHQAIADPGRLRVCATGPGGVIEAVKADDWPAYGVQWHPEKMHEPEQRRLLDHLVDEAQVCQAP
jgi:gamma-glutamyl-gamma-aminobutyrate hydrolase PuuD